MAAIYVAEPRILVWLRERTVLFKSEHELTTGGEYTENILIFAFAVQSSLSRVRNDNAVRTCKMCAVRTRQHSCHIHKPVLGIYYSGTIPCCETCTNHDITVYYAQLHIDDAILCIINDVMIVLY